MVEPGEGGREGVYDKFISSFGVHSMILRASEIGCRGHLCMLLHWSLEMFFRNSSHCCSIH